MTDLSVGVTPRDDQPAPVLASRARVVLAGFVTVEQQDAMTRLREGAGIRTHRALDEEPIRKQEIHRRTGIVYRLRGVLLYAPGIGMTVVEVRALAKSGVRTVRLLHAMKDVEVVRSYGKPYRYRLKA